MIITKEIIHENLILLVQNCFFTVLIMIVSELLNGIIFTNLLKINVNTLNNISNLFIFNISICLTAILIINVKDIFITMLKNKKQINPNNSIIKSIFIISITVILLFNYSLMYKYFNDYFDNKIFVVILILSGFYLIIALTFLYTNYISNKNIEKLEIKEEEYNKLKLYSDITESLVEDISKFKHDYNNVIFMMNGYLQNNDYDGLKKYFSKEILKENKYHSIFKLKKVKASGLKGLLAAKIDQMIRDNIDVSIEILNDIVLYHIDELDLCRIIGILLDNAYDAAKNSSEKSVCISFVRDEALNITILNSYSGKSININDIYKKGYSSKGDNRGIGLHNVKEILNEKYPNVILNTYIEESIFIQDLHIS
ncbi:sensor histidine kinase [Clostridium sp. ZS2-4]|uniref:sensor histidine kinase n=1 Tax=Clostridium sp. ZS2-4 TaxID=2987703 RepID=UPI00227B0EE7|nr:GHKL domain-containing protein [Clostridium sp. ZS2-4]MCY6355340.1 GHKL domain-containing protein [Clostridium sp. ZS2-4]